jgi:ATP-binding cassette subfamily B protein
MPGHVRLLLQDQLGDGVEPTAFALADISPSGQFGQTWVALTDGQLAIADLEREGGPHVRLTRLGPDVELEILEGVGSSRFRVIEDGKLVEELRFSRRQAKRFSRLLHLGKGHLRETDADRPPNGAAHEERYCDKCGRLIPDWAEACPGCLRKRRILWRLLSYAMPYKRDLIVGLLCAMGVTLVMLIPPKLSKHLIDDVLTPSEHQKPELLWPLIGIMAGTFVLRSLLRYVRLSRLAKMSELMTHDLRSDAFAHLQKLSLSYYSKKPTGQLISRITHDTDRLWDFIAFGVVELAMSALMVIGIAAILFAEDWRLASLTMIPIPAGALLTYFHTLAIRKFFRRIWAKWSRMTSVLSDAIPGARVVKAFTQERREVKRFTDRSRAVVDDAMELHREWTTYWPKVTLLLNLGTLLIWAYAAPKILHGTDARISLGLLIEFLGYVWMFYGPIEQLGMMNRMFQRAATSAQRVFEVLDTPPSIYTKTEAVRKQRIEGAVTFENVCFSYDGIKQVLEDISFSVEPGQMIGLAGPSGGGKTTMVNLICRFYDVNEGRILIDGTDVRDLDLHELRSQVGVVLQEPYLFRGTIAENIAYGNPRAELEQIITASKAANAHDFIVGFPDGYDTLVGERGQTLSGGERQRISIARAILNNPRILILDEATSSVDTKTETKIQEAIDRLVQGRTTFAIAHRLSTLRRADRLVILEKGKLVEQGTHDELLETDGVYAKLQIFQSELLELFAVLCGSRPTT